MKSDCLERNLINLSRLFKKVEFGKQMKNLSKPLKKKGLAIFAFVFCGIVCHAEEKPNVILIMADDKAHLA